MSDMSVHGHWLSDIAPQCLESHSGNWAESGTAGIPWNFKFFALRFPLNLVESLNIEIHGGISWHFLAFRFSHFHSSLTYRLSERVTTRSFLRCRSWQAMGDKAALAAMGISDAPPPKVVETVPHFTSHAEDPLMMGRSYTIYILFIYKGIEWN